MIFQSIADGLLNGAIIGLGAIGVSLAMRILRFASFAHSELLSWGAYLAFTVTSFAAGTSTFGPLSFGWPLVFAIVLAAAGTCVVALVVDRLVFVRLRARNAASVTMVFAAFGCGLILRNLLVLIWGTQSQYYSNNLQIAVQIVPGIRMRPDQIFVLALAAVVVVVLHLWLKFSRFGTAMRAVAESPELARICGVRVDSVITATWIASGTLAAMSGVFLGLTVQLRPDMGFNLLLDLFTAAILGGAGSLVGAFLGGLSVGLIESLSVLVISAGYKQATPFLVMLVLFYFRPQGLFGRGEMR